MTDAFSLRAIAGALDVSHTTVWRDLRGKPAPARVTGRDGKSYPVGEEGQRQTAAVALALRRHGWTQSRIAAHLGLSQPTVSRLLRAWRETES